MKKIAICTIGVGECLSYADITNRNKQAYCDKHGYTFIPLDYILDFRAANQIQQACWSKFVLMQNIIQSGLYDYVIWLDNDMWIFNMDLNIDELLIGDYDGYFSKDGQGINLGAFALPCNENSLSLLSDWVSREKWLNHKWSESMALNEWANEAERNIKYIDRRLWNTFFGEHMPCNILHLVGESQSARLGYFQQCEKGLIK